MSKILDFPSQPKPERIDVQYFEKFSDAALLMHCFEVLNTAVDAVEQGVQIHFKDATYIELIEAYWALQVLFKRKTGNSAPEVSAKHAELMTRHMLEGGTPPELQIPIVTTLRKPLAPEAFDKLSQLQMVGAAFVYADSVREAIMTNSPQALAMEEARVASIDATTVLRQLAKSMGIADHVQRKPGETLQ